MTDTECVSPASRELTPWFKGAVPEGPAGVEAAAFNAYVEDEGTAAAPNSREALLALRDALAAARTEPSCPFEDHNVPTPDGHVAVRLFLPPDPRGAYLAIHGGGWVTGGVDQENAGLSTFATTSNVAVASVEYRLAPEHPYPAAPDDCEAAAVWFVDHVQRELGLDRLLLGGGSAGAHLALVTLLRLRDKHAMAGEFCGTNLAAGVFDLSGTPSQRRWERDLVVSRTMIDLMIDCFTPGLDLEARRHPDVSPLYADLGGLPPAFFTVGTADPFLDDTLFLAGRWRAAGNDCELRVLPEGMHGFAGLPLQIATMSNRAGHAWVERLLEPTD